MLACGIHKEAWRAQRRPEGPKGSPKGRRLEVGARRAPKLLLHYIALLHCIITLLVCVAAAGAGSSVSLYLPRDLGLQYIALLSSIIQYYSILNYTASRSQPALGAQSAGTSLLPPLPETSFPLPNLSPFYPPSLILSLPPFNVFSFLVPPLYSMLCTLSDSAYTSDKARLKSSMF